MNRFDDRVAIVTGGTSGIGAATARRLSHEGARVTIAGRDVERGEATARELGDLGRFVAADVTDRDSVARLVEQLHDTEGRLDVVVNAAGVLRMRPFASMPPEVWSDTIDVNLSGVFHVCQLALPLMRDTVAADGGDGTGAIVNVSSLNAIGGDTGMTAYGAAKAGVTSLTRSLALEMIGHGVRVNSVSPGAVDTPMIEGATSDAERTAAFHRAIPAGRFGRADEIAAAIAFVASDDASFMVGADLVVDGGVTSASGHPDLLAMFDMET